MLRFAITRSRFVAPAISTPLAALLQQSISAFSTTPIQRCDATFSDLAAIAKQMDDSKKHQRSSPSIGNNQQQQHHRRFQHNNSNRRDNNYSNSSNEGHRRHHNSNNQHSGNRDGGGGEQHRRRFDHNSGSSSSSSNNNRQRYDRDHQQHHRAAADSTKQSSAPSSINSTTTVQELKSAATVSAATNSTSNVGATQQQQQQQAQQAAAAPASAASDVRSLELKLRQAYERLQRVLERNKQAAGEPTSSLSESGTASVAVPISKLPSVVSAQENAYVEQFFEPDTEKQQQQQEQSTAAVVEGVPQIRRREFGVARAEIVGVIAEPVRLMRDTLLNQDFAKLVLRVTQQQEQQDETTSAAAPLTFEVRVYGPDVLIRSCVDGGLPNPALSHTVLHVSGRMIRTDTGDLIIAASDEYGSVSVVLVDPK